MGSSVPWEDLVVFSLKPKSLLFFSIQIQLPVDSCAAWCRPSNAIQSVVRVPRVRRAGSSFAGVVAGRRFSIEVSAESIFPKFRRFQLNSDDPDEARSWG
jgi:hypothetical protein